MKNCKKAFTLVELVVVIVILSILSTIGFVSYSNYISQARDAQRKSDIAQLESSLKNYKLKRGVYPSLNGNVLNINYGSELLAQQGFINNELLGLDITKIPKDPKVDKYYVYSITKNKQEFQISASLENGGENIAIVRGDYKTVSKNILPMINFAIENNIDLNTDKTKFIFDAQTYNLPYKFSGDGVKADGDSAYLSTQLARESFYGGSSDFRNCLEIKEAGKILLENSVLEYQILDENGNIQNTTCSGSLQF